MAWRGVHIGDPSRLSLGDRRLQVDQAERGPVSLPLEDIAWIVLDTPQVTLTGALLAACAEAGIPVVQSDARHTPVGLYLPFHGHWQQAGVARTQISASQPLNKRLWQRVVRRKIENQAAILDRVQLEGGNTIRQMMPQVKSGDPGNVEARAARYYWQRLFLDFRRHDDGDLRNAMLNYAYAILRSAMARALVAAGLLPAFGIHHAGAQNAFNLADDLLEVLRPVADRMVLHMSDGGARPEETSLTRAHRQKLAGVMNETVLFGGEQVTVLPAADRMVASLVRALTEGKVDALDLPIV